MRGISRLGRPLLAVASAPQCPRRAATLPIAARRALSTTVTLRSNDSTASKASQDEQLALNLAEADAEIAALEERHRQSAKIVKHGPKSRLKTKKERTRAPTEAKAKSKGYVPATNIDELENIGGLQGWWDQPGHWGEESQYVGFSSRSIAEKIEDGNVCEALVRQALVEALVLAQLDREALKGKWVPGNRKDFNRATAISLRAFGALGAVAEAQNDAAVKIARMVLSFDRPDNEGGEIISAKEAKALVDSWDPKWKAMPVRDPLVKFALHKRVFQLTGHYVHDAKLAQINTVGQFIEAIHKAPKPTKVAEAIVKEGSLLELPNVHVSSRRITPIDKEIALGRWKVIQEELEKRDLPVTGHEHLQRPVQRDWIQGKH